MSEPTTFLSLRVEAFRGFRDACELPLSASAVIAAGPNGTGKTSFFDSIQWLLLGSLKRLESLRAKPTDEYIVNQYRLGEAAVVESELMLAGRPVRLRRSGTSRTTLLEWHEDGRVLRGEEAERELASALTPSPTISLETAMLTAGLLQQDVMRSVLEAKANERFEVLNRLLGLDSLERFEQAARDWTRQAADVLSQARADEEELRKRRRQLDAQLATLEAEAAARPSTESAQADFEGALAAQSMVALRASLVSLSVAEIAADLGAAQNLLRRTDTNLEAVRVERDGLPTPSYELDQLEQELAVAEERVASRQEEAASARRAVASASERSSELVRLVAVAIPLLSDVCPVCGQEIEPAAVAESLRKRGDDRSDLIALQEAADRAAQVERETIEERDALATHVHAIRRLMANHAELAARERDTLADLVSGLAELKATVVTLPDSLSTANIDDLRAAEHAVSQLEPPVQRLLAATDIGVGSHEARRLRAELASVDEAQKARTDRASDLARRQRVAKNLQDATVIARVAVGRQRVETLRPLVADIYNRLDPHPSFTALDIEHDIYRKRGTMAAVAKDPLTGSEGNPILIFSSSQANIAALSYFLALGWTAGDAGMPFVLLDDPLQSMDDVNVLGFADLCRFIRSRRQMFLSTHERRFALLLARKLAPRSAEDTTIVLNFRGWDRSGPQVEVDESPQQIDESTARLAVA